MFNADKLITRFDKVLRVITGISPSVRSMPGVSAHADMDVTERQHSAGLMRVNHVGEVCAQALYDAQSRFARSESLRRQFAHAGREEEDHLAWTAERLRELDSRPSLLNPLWYAGAYALGAAAAHAGDAWSLGFVVETERQVEAHLASHLELLPAGDTQSRAIVEQMRLDEIEHGNVAKEMGAKDLPEPVRFMMRLMAKGMTKTAYYL
jgi:3-demethoxyubiquinol 3-hydroxylase